MNKIKVKFTREELYEGVWSKTMVSLAKEYTQLINFRFSAGIRAR